jgi:LmbE family N-acetylglucosaminyl deacetylase
MAGAVVLAVGAHPDDIEFFMAGTLLLLKDAGASIHMWNLANGCLGSVRHAREEAARVRWAEAQEAARTAGASIRPPLFDDLAVFHDAPSLARVAAGIREIGPNIILTHSPQDYMEDHQNACRLAVTAAFARGMPNFVTDPPRGVCGGDVALYHAMPSSLRGPLLEAIHPHACVDIGRVLARKRAMLSCHRSQKEWLDVSQGMDSYLQTMENLAVETGRMSGLLAHAEGWRRHNPLGFGPQGWNPLKDMLKEDYRDTTAE